MARRTVLCSELSGIETGSRSARAIPGKVRSGFAEIALAMHEAQNVVDESRMGIREVPISTLACDAGQLKRLLIIENMIGLLGIRRPTGGNGNVDGMEIAEIDVYHAAG